MLFFLASGDICRLTGFGARGARTGVGRACPLSEQTEGSGMSNRDKVGEGQKGSKGGGGGQAGGGQSGGQGGSGNKG